MRPNLLLLAVLALGACDQATNSRYLGVPVAVVGGRLTTTESLHLGGPVKLAILWEPSGTRPSSTVSQPSGVEVTEVSYTGTFPQDFSFQLYGPPQADSSSIAPGQKGRVGFLVAYEDLDGDGRLQLSGPGELPRDRLLGASVRTPTPEALSPYMGSFVVYSEEAQPTGIPQGFSLITLSETGLVIQPLDLAGTIRVNLQLDGDPMLNLFICGDYYAQRALSPRELCGITLRTAPAVNAFLYLGSWQPMGAFFSIRVFDGLPCCSAGSVAGVVELDGVRLPAPQGGADLFEGSGADASMLHVGANTLRVTQPNYEPLELVITIPERPVLRGVTDGATVDAGSTLEVTWEPVAGADDEEWLATVEGGNYEALGYGAFQLGGRQFSVAIPPGAPAVRVGVDAFWHTNGPSGGYLSGENGATLVVNVAP
jgi:hypothetical protein